MGNKDNFFESKDDYDELDEISNMLQASIEHERQAKIIASANIIIAHHKKAQSYSKRFASSFDTTLLEKTTQILEARNKELRNSPWQTVAEVEQFLKALRKRR